MFDNLPNVRMTTLSNGIRVATQKIAGMQSAAVGIRIDSSTRHEDAESGGASHFIEHLLFKGTPTRTADRIMEEFDALGARVNAYTSQEEVFYYAVSRAAAVPATLAILADMFVHSNLPPTEVEKERGVVLQEIAMNYDNPGRFVYNRFHQGFWKAHPLGSPILGTAESIGAISRDRLMSHKLSHYLAHATIVSAAGNLEHDRIVDLTERLLGGLPTGRLPVTVPEPGWSPATADHLHYQRQMEQTQFYMGYPLPPAGNEHRHTLAVFNQILGSGMSSRLFREVRERRSLAYSVYSQMASYSDTAGLLIYAGTSADRAQEAIDVSHGEVLRFCRERVSHETLEAAKEQIRSKRLMALDECETQVRRISNTTSLLGAPEPIATSLQAIAAVTAEDIQSVAQELFENVVPRVESVGPGDGPGLPR
ncbi:pitrilysin family protein [Geobacter sp. SVR]|uniref:M16 family metallopeptidase n=1 Tax=Geobacter sp. SVR TaxID=2495594 RepID=UPI00143F002A|nr:pitrilysin family protein [Geobacter sp. SVR]BCS52557.1 peptidase M16 [Geobacter sp. SVR]GCF84005.1 peptidase M16 [Geobacter sp. SVR]